jgi:hypothetical protein
MSLYGEARDISMFRHVNRELMRNIISQQVVFYKCNITETKVNMYGETSGGRLYDEPLLIYSLIERGDQTAPIQDDLVGFSWPVTFRFLRDDLVEANTVPEIGDVVMWQDAYWEIDNENISQLFVGKDPDYPYNDSTGTNILETDLDRFGYNVSVICTAHYVPADRIGIDKQRL